jgi:hypothetical protein
MLLLLTGISKTINYLIDCSFIFITSPISRRTHVHLKLKEEEEEEEEEGS